MSASCLVLPALGQLGGAEPGSLLDRLEQLPDPRSRQGRRHELGYLLGVAAAATAAVGHDSISAIAQWAAEVPARVLASLGGRPDPLTGVVAPPSRHTVGRVLARVDASQVQATADAWTAQRSGHRHRG